jgi:hypothetical protein
MKWLTGMEYKNREQMKMGKPKEAEINFTKMLEIIRDFQYILFHLINQNTDYPLTARQ